MDPLLNSEQTMDQIKSKYEDAFSESGLLQEDDSKDFFSLMETETQSDPYIVTEKPTVTTPSSVPQISIPMNCSHEPSLQNVDLSRCEFSNDSSYDVYHYPEIEKLKQAHKLDDLLIPGMVLYQADDGSKVGLFDIQFVNAGNFGYVFSYQNWGPLPPGWSEISSPEGKIVYTNGSTVQANRPRSTVPYAKIKVAVKTYKNPNDLEITIVSQLQDQGIDCNLINSRIVESNGVIVCLMDYMSGPLSRISHTMDIQTIFLCIKQLAYYLDCLAQKNLSYTDLKTNNILYKCVNGELKLVLGDLGSICDYGQSGTMTYPPPESFQTGTFFCNEPSMIWGLGMIMFQLMNISLGKAYHPVKFSGYKKNPLELEFAINKVILKSCQRFNLLTYSIRCQNPMVGNLCDLLRAMCFTNPDVRIRLGDIASMEPIS